MKIAQANLASSLLFIVALNTHAQATADTPNENPLTNSVVQEESSNSDPWQGYNRSIFTFNMAVDKVLLKPLAVTYEKLTPAFFRQGVSNVFANVLEVPSALNGVLQGKLSHAAHDTGRLLINSTLGVAGIMDVAQHMGLKGSNKEDFGQTLAVWGVSTGPYVVLPFLGASSLRDMAALPVDWYSDPKAYIDHVPTSNSTRAASLIDIRAGLLPLEKAITGDKYTFIRDAYLQRRHYLVNDGVVEDSFGAEEDGDYSF